MVFMIFQIIVSFLVKIWFVNNSELMLLFYMWHVLCQDCPLVHCLGCWLLLRFSWLYNALENISLGIRENWRGIFSTAELLETICAQQFGRCWWSNLNTLWTGCFHIEVFFSSVTWIEISFSLSYSTAPCHSAPTEGSLHLILLNPHCLLLCFLCLGIGAKSVFNYKTPWWIISLNKSDSN